MSPVPLKIQLGASLTEGRGAGAIPEIGKNAAIENIEDIRSFLSKGLKWFSSRLVWAVELEQVQLR
jgi:cell division protein FtsZ